MNVVWYLDRDNKPEPPEPIDDPRATQLPGEWRWTEKRGWIYYCIDVENEDT